jgi:hypothetical protein
MFGQRQTKIFLYNSEHFGAVHQLTILANMLNHFFQHIVKQCCFFKECELISPTNLAR